MAHFIFHKSIFSFSYYKDMLHLRLENGTTCSPFLFLCFKKLFLKSPVNMDCERWQSLSNFYDSNKEPQRHPPITSVPPCLPPPPFPIQSSQRQPSPNREKHGIWHWPLGSHCPMIFINLHRLMSCLLNMTSDMKSLQHALQQVPVTITPQSLYIIESTKVKNAH